MVPSLQGYAAAVLEALSAAELATCAADLVALDRQVADNDALRAALTDTSVAPTARRAVLADLLEGKVSQPARRLAAHAAFVSHAPEVPTSLGWLAQRARRAAEGQAELEPGLGVLGARNRVGGYAQAIFEDADLAVLDVVEDELFTFARAVEGNAELHRAFTDRDLPVEARTGVVDQLLAGRANAQTVSLARYAVVGGRARDFVGTLDYLVEETARTRGWRVAKVFAAEEIAEDRRGELTATLSRITGNQVELQVSIDPTLLAGAIVEVGDLRIDSTARRRLSALREHMSNEDYVSKMNNEEGAA